MASSSAEQSGHPTRQERRERYESVLRTVDLNTTPMQRPWVSEWAIVANRSQAGVPRDETRATLQAAVENGDLIRLGSGRRCAYCRNEQATLERAVSEVGTTVDAPSELLADLNAHLQELRDHD